MSARTEAEKLVRVAKREVDERRGASWVKKLRVLDKVLEDVKSVKMCEAYTREG